MGPEKKKSHKALSSPGRESSGDSRGSSIQPTLKKTQVTMEAQGDFLALQEAAEEALAFIIQATGCPGGMIAVQREEEDQPVVFALDNAPPSWKTVRDDSLHPLWQTIRRVLESGREESADPALSLAAAVPLVARSSRQGVLLVSGPPLSPTARARLVEAAHVAGRTLKISRSSLSLQEADKELASLHMIASILNSNLELDDVQRTMVAGIRQIMDCEIGCLILMDESQGLLDRKVLGEEDDWILKETREFQSGEAEDCLNATRPIRIDDATAKPELCKEMEQVLGRELRSFLCAPLRAGEQPIGVLDMINKRGGPFTPYDQELISLLATSIADAISNQRLIRQLKVVNLDLKSNREELLTSRNTLRALFDNIPASLYIVDRAYALRVINQSRAKRAQSRPNLLVGRCCYEALFNRISPCPGCRVVETMDTGRITLREYRFADADGVEKEWEIGTYPIFEESNRVYQVIVHEEDVTEARRMEANLAQSEKLAAVGQLAAGVAHEINNPLTAVIANAQLMQRSLPPDSEMQESVELILIAGNRAAQVVRNLLDFARKEEYRLDRTDVNETIRKAFDLVQHEVMSRSVTLRFDPQTDLPRILASGDHLQGVWLNLIINALDSFGGEPGNILISTHQSGQEIHVVVEDDGKGIPPENLPRIFEPFFTTKLPGRGTGLGLSVCHQIIKQHNGRILVESHLGQGTKFTVILPIP
jgi:two-component system NtrC family sensor kinase